MSQIVSGFIEVALGPMERMVVLLEQANGASEEALADVADSLAKAERQLLPGLTAAVDQANLFLGELEAAVGPGEGSEAADAGAPTARTRRTDRAGKQLTTPVPVTRGSGRPKGTKGGMSHG